MSPVCLYNNVGAPLVDIEITTAELVYLTARIAKLINYQPVITEYVSSWLKALSADKELQNDLSPYDDAIKSFLSVIPNRYQTIIRTFNDYEKLCMKMLITKERYEPFLFIETGKVLADYNHDFDLDKYVLNTNSRLKDLNKEISAYEYILDNSPIDDHTRIYHQKLLHIRRQIIERGVITISRAQSASLKMLLLEIPERHIPVAEMIIKTYVLKNKKGKPTTVFLHIVCCIIYELLQEHRKDNSVVNCRRLTANLIRCLFQQKIDGKLYFNIDERTVEYAIKGK